MTNNRNEIRLILENLHRWLHRPKLYSKRKSEMYMHHIV
jgi:hypothetical protein